MSYNKNMIEAKEKAEYRCPRCESIEGQMRAGYSKSGSQRCVCRNCKYKYTPNPKTLGYSDEMRQKALHLYFSGVSGREVGRILNINKASVFNWIKKNDKEFNEKL